MLNVLKSIIGVIAAVSVNGLATAQMPEMDEDTNVYLVSLITPNKNIDVKIYKMKTENYLSKHGGAYLTSPVYVEKELVNEYLPEVYSAFPSEYVTFQEFENGAALEAYLEDVQPHYQKWDENFDYIVRFKAMNMPLPGSGAVLPVVKQESLGGGEAFLLLNATSILNNQEAAESLTKYTETGGVVVEAGTQFFGTFANIGPVTGEYPYQVLFLSEWVSEEAFEQVHHNPFWTERAKYRNAALSGFTEAKGVPLK